MASMPASPCAARYASSACPSPYQPGRLIRACDQAKVHGIARSESIVGASSRRPRAAGRDPSRRSDSSRIGVMSRKNEANPGSSWTSGAIGGARGGGQLVEDRRPDRERPLEPRVVLGRRRQQDRAGHLLEVAPGDRRVGVVGGDDLALLGQLEPAVDRARRLAEDRPVRRPAAAPERAAATVEERQLDATRPGRLDERRLRLVERPGRGDEPRLLVRIGVAEHHLLAVAAPRDPGPVGRIVEERPEDRAGGGQRVGRFEERDDVEDRRGGASLAGGGVPSELEHVGDVRGGRGEAHDVAVARLGPEPRLGRRDRPERGEDLIERDARRDLGRPGRTGPERGQRRLVDRRVLADLERGEVEPERPDLPAQLGDLAPGDALETVGDERVGDLDQFGIQLGRRAVPPGQRRGLADQRGPRPAQPLGDEPEALAVRLVGEAPAELSVGLREVLGIAGQARRERPGDPFVPRSRRRSSASAGWRPPRTRAGRGRPGSAASAR